MPFELAALEFYRLRNDSRSDSMVTLPDREPQTLEEDGGELKLTA